MGHHELRPVFLIVNIRPVIERFAKYPSLYTLFPFISLSDLISGVMMDRSSRQQHSRISDLLWGMLEDSHGTKELSGEYLQTLEEIFYQMRFSIQERIEPVLPVGWESGNLVFHQWMGPHDMVIKPEQ